MIRLPKELFPNGQPRRRPRRYGLAAQIEQALGLRTLPRRDRQHLASLRRQDCEACRKLGIAQTTPTEAAHMGSHALGRKASDRDARPLCAEHHRFAIDSAHVLGRNFETYFGFKEEL